MIKKIAFALLAGTCLGCEDHIIISTQQEIISDQRNKITSLERKVSSQGKEILKLTRENELKDYSIKQINQNVSAYITMQQRIDQERQRQNAY